ncbi:MAG: hypothetical protein IKJ33_05610 [Clostridia bacterium]|nr:hypothetical protein [Clostridia bacterium]
MKKTFKLLVLFMGSLTVIIIGAMTGYLFITKNKTFYIYDVRLVEPVKSMEGFIYTEIPDSQNEDKKAENVADSGTQEQGPVEGEDGSENQEEEEKEEEEFSEYTSIKNQTIYMKSKATNLMPIAVYVNASSRINSINITSSNTSIAKIIYKDNACFVEFLREGLATITAEYYGVSDSFTVQIYDQLPSNFSVYDYDYYGDYAGLFPNRLITYADDQEYRYDYLLNNVSNTGSNANINGDLIRIDRENLKEDIFSNVYIDSATNELVVKCKKPEDLHKDNLDSTIILQSFYYTEDNEIVIENNYEVKVHIVRYIPEFLQIEVSSTPDFVEKTVYTNTIRTDIKTVITEEMMTNPSLITEEVEKRLDECLQAEKAENYLAVNGEKSTYKAFFTDNVEKVYVRVRMVYTNGDIVYLKHGQNAQILFNGLENFEGCMLDPTGEYYIMTLNDTNYFTTDGKIFSIGVYVNDFDFNHTFKFEYRTQTNSNINDFYKLDAETGVYTYSYWDERAKFANEIYNKEGKVVAFGV